MKEKTQLYHALINFIIYYCFLRFVFSVKENTVFAKGVNETL